MMLYLKKKDLKTQPQIFYKNNVYISHKENLLNSESCFGSLVCHRLPLCADCGMVRHQSRCWIPLKFSSQEGSPLMLLMTGNILLDWKWTARKQILDSASYLFMDIEVEKSKWNITHRLLNISM